MKNKKFKVNDHGVCVEPTSHTIYKADDKGWCDHLIIRVGEHEGKWSGGYNFSFGYSGCSCPVTFDPKFSKLFKTEASCLKYWIDHFISDYKNKNRRMRSNITRNKNRILKEKGQKHLDKILATDNGYRKVVKQIKFNEFLIEQLEEYLDTYGGASRRLALYDKRKTA